MSWKVPPRGFVNWNVGTGDSTSVVIDDERWLQVDLNHKSDADKDGSAYAAMVDELVDRLPQRNKKPYLAGFALTHPDQDHCQGFARLLDEVEIGELLFTPRIFDEYKKDLCDDAVAFKEEAERRVKATIKNPDVGSGDRVRVIGYSDRLKEELYKGFPEERLTVPGEAFTELDGEDLNDIFRAFVHAPFKDDLDSDDRNATSLALQVRLIEDGTESNVLLFGDHAYPVLRRIFDRSKKSDLAWGAFLTPHHCSKSAMYWADKADDTAALHQDILDSLSDNKESSGYCVSSCEPIPGSNKKGDNPPHAKAKRRYEEIVDANHFIVSQEHPDENSPEPITFEATADGLTFTGSSGASKSENKAKAAAAAAVVSTPAAPREPQRYGQSQRNG